MHTEPTFQSDAVNQQISSDLDLVSVDVTKLLIIYTGGTIGMKNCQSHGYVPVSGYLQEQLSMMGRFHNPTLNIKTNTVNVLVNDSEEKINSSPIMKTQKPVKR
jgi:L-asparaginase/Glu-tRNA(Gln) amidotransferase subunit D